MTHPPRPVARALALILTAGALALAPSAAHAVDPIAGPQTSGDTQFPHVGNGGYDVTDYDINMVWTPASIPGITNDQSIAATTTITATTTGAPLSSFSLDFEGLTVGSVKVNDVTVPSANITRVQNAGQIKYKLIITPVTPVDGVFTTVVTYSGTPVAHTDADGSKEGWNATSDGATFVNQPVGSMTGFPNNNTPQDKATYTFTLSVPTQLGGGTSAAVANGVLTSKTAIAGSRTQWVWDVAKPMASELALISIGRYDMYTADLAVTGSGTVKEWSFIDPLTGVSSTTLRPKIKPRLDFLATRYGAYPGNATGVVVDNVAGLGINYALETQDRPFFPNSVPDGTLTHELMHQWFGNNVSPNYWSDLWLNEGPADYSEQQFADENGTEQYFFDEYNDTANNSIWTTPASNPNDTNSADLFGAHVYTRGGIALEALRTAIGPTSFLAFLKEWQTRYGGTSRGTQDFFALAEEVSGKELTAFFQDWILDANKPSAWPGKFTSSVTSDPASGLVAPGGAVSYTLKALNTGKVPLLGQVVTLDLTDVLDDATLGTLPANTTQDGNTITWTVPSTATGNTAQAVIPVTVKPGVTAATLTAVASIPTTTLGGTCTPACTSTLSAGLDTLTPTADPTITGTAKVGQTLTAETAGWASGTGFTYTWKRGGTAIAGATESTYTLVADDLGAVISVDVTGSKPGFNPVTRTSAGTDAVAAGDQAATPTPTISGTAKVGQTLTAVPGSWDPGVALAYQWAAAGTDLGGATDPTYVPVAGDVGKTITVRVTGTKTGYTTVTRTSDPTVAVAEGTQSSTPTPTFSTVSPKVGETVTAIPGTWDPGVTKTYQWAAAGDDITGATETTYTPTPGDVGKALTVKVTGTKPGYATVTKTSNPTIPVAAGDQSSTPTPTISGTVRVGQTLRANAGSWDPGVMLSYQWSADGTTIPGATSPTYALRAGDIRKRITVTLYGTRPGYTTISRTSAPTTPVAAGILTPGPVPTIKGRPEVGRKLKVRAGSYGPGVRLSFQWYAGRKPIAGATASRLLLTDALVGKRIRVKVTQSLPGYASRAVTSRKTPKVS